jgi:transposase
MDMSAAYAKGASVALPQAEISYDHFHVIVMAIQAMDDVRREELRTEPEGVAAAPLSRSTRNGLEPQNVTWRFPRLHLTKSGRSNF